MEVKSRKQLHKHALPIIMIAAAILAVSALEHYPGKPSGSAIIRGLTSRGVVHIQPLANGVGRITLDTSSTAAAPTPGASLASGVAATGSQTQLTFNFEAPSAAQP